MSGFGGAGPGLSILMGVAQGVTSANKRKREMEQEAIRNRLWEQQMSESEARVKIAADQEARFREKAQFDAEQARLKAERDAQLEQQKAELRQASIENVARQIMRDNPDIIPEVALQNAQSVVDNHIPWSEFAAEDPNANASNASMLRYLDMVEQRRLLQEGLNQIYGNPAARQEIAQAPTLDEALVLADTFNIPEDAATEYWNRAGKGKIQDPEADTTPVPYAKMDSNEQRAVNDMASEFAQAGIQYATEWMAENPYSNLSFETVVKGWIHNTREARLRAHRQGDGLDDYSLSALTERADFILNQILTKMKEDGTLPDSTPEGAVKF